MECERRFLVDPIKALIALAGGAFPSKNRTYQRQGYVVTDPKRTVRVRIEGLDTQKAYLTLKGKKDKSGNGEELEGEIPLELAENLLNCSLSMGEVSKWRFTQINACIQTLDIFLGKNAGLVIFEIEGEPAVVAQFVPPSWVGEEITNDHRYSCSQLAQKPFSTWEEDGNED